MIRGKYLRERKAIRVKRRFKCLVVLTIILIIYRIFANTYSLYESEASTSGNVDIAFFATSNTYETNLINLGDIGYGESKECIFSISNYKIEEDEDGNPVLDENGNEIHRISEVYIDYNILVRATTNFDFEYELYELSLDDDSALGENISQELVVQDENNTYFKNILDESGTFEPGVEVTKRYKLIVTYPVGADYKNIVDCIEISFDAKQK